MIKEKELPLAGVNLWPIGSQAENYVLNVEYGEDYHNPTSEDSYFILFLEVEKFLRTLFYVGDVSDWEESKVSQHTLRCLPNEVNSVMPFLRMHILRSDRINKWLLILGTSGTYMYDSEIKFVYEEGFCPPPRKMLNGVVNDYVKNLPKPSFIYWEGEDDEIIDIIKILIAQNIVYNDYNFVEV